MDNKITLNLYSQRCTPILTKVVRQIDLMKHGDVLVINSDNHCALKKIKNICFGRGYTIDIQRIDKDAMRYLIKIE